MHITARPYAGLADLHALQRTITASWLLARPFVNMTVGDVTWWMTVSPLEVDWTTRIRLWEADGDVVAWGGFQPPGEFLFHLRADLPAAPRHAVVAELVEWLTKKVASHTTPPGEGAPAEAPSHLTTDVLDTDHGLQEELRSLGFTPADEPSYSHFIAPLDESPAAPVLPPGYTIRHVRGEDEIPARVSVHRAAFAPSRMTVEKYQRFVATNLYAFERDLVVEAPDGSFAAFTMVFWDPVARIGEFEPVGTHPDHRQKGLAKAVNLAGLHLLRRLGALEALVFSRPTNAASEALYTSAGFRRVTVHRAWTRPLQAR
ncbi:GNAT family N-acetyltransferase [Polyangium sp. 6x1]|uniref:GNAT family N-acetyltransferase n=1 Tax=Polyangium sp. 6x1 TaxID=3042689 RepID=UPI002483140B|nr:GNAT family N-acetyltransferase [Polyangium sp. 6x1]MDI1444545.1 GNAT family N-acetyltransferase [Polyangium sp. 6x1]